MKITYSGYHFPDCFVRNFEEISKLIEPNKSHNGFRIDWGNFKIEECVGLICSVYDEFNQYYHYSRICSKHFPLFIVLDGETGGGIPERWWLTKQEAIEEIDKYVLEILPVLETELGRVSRIKKQLLKDYAQEYFLSNKKTAK